MTALLTLRFSVSLVKLQQVICTFSCLNVLLRPQPVDIVCVCVLYLLFCLKWALFLLSQGLCFLGPAIFTIGPHPAWGGYGLNVTTAAGMSNVEAVYTDRRSSLTLCVILWLWNLVIWPPLPFVNVRTLGISVTSIFLLILLHLLKQEWVSS